jgi:RNA polymerase sigma-70 factor, ECF subfamily
MAVASSTGTERGSAIQPRTFEEFFAAQKDRLLRILYVVTGSRDEAEDIAQEAFTKVLERWGRVRSLENPAGYLERTAMNIFRNRYRRAKRAARSVVGRGYDQDAFAVVEDRDEAARALASLTPRQRAALVLTEVLGYSGKEAGQILGVSASTVWVLTHKAREALRDKGADSDA